MLTKSQNAHVCKCGARETNNPKIICLVPRDQQIVRLCSELCAATGAAEVLHKVKCATMYILHFVLHVQAEAKGPQRDIATMIVVVPVNAGSSITWGAKQQHTLHFVKRSTIISCNKIQVVEQLAWWSSRARAKPGQSSHTVHHHIGQNNRHNTAYRMHAAL